MQFIYSQNSKISCTSFHILLPFFEAAGYLKALDYQRWEIKQTKAMIMSLFPYVAYNFLRLFNTKCYPTLPSPHLILRSLCLTPLYDQNLYNSRIKYDADLRDRDGKIMTNITKSSQLNHKRKKNITILDFPIFPRLYTF